MSIPLAILLLPGLKVVFLEYTLLFPELTFEFPERSSERKHFVL